ncbi:hypothetical protein ACVW1A_005273 [Bradyrhizobium sp. LB1.3]
MPHAKHIAVDTDDGHKIRDEVQQVAADWIRRGFCPHCVAGLVARAGGFVVCAVSEAASFPEHHRRYNQPRP